MKRILLLLTASALLVSPALAQTDSTPPPPDHPPGGPGGPGHGGPHLDFLTPEQQAELKKAHDAAFAADPTLAAEDKKMHEAREAKSGPPSEAQKAEFKAFREKLDAAMLKADPAVAPILEEIKKHKKHKGGPGGGAGGPPPPPDSTAGAAE